MKSSALTEEVAVPAMPDGTALRETPQPWSTAVAVESPVLSLDEQKARDKRIKAIESAAKDLCSHSLKLRHPAIMDLVPVDFDMGNFPGADNCVGAHLLPIIERFDLAKKGNNPKPLNKLLALWPEYQHPSPPKSAPKRQHDDYKHHQQDVAYLRYESPTKMQELLVAMTPAALNHPRRISSFVDVRCPQVLFTERDQLTGEKTTISLTPATCAGVQRRIRNAIRAFIDMEFKEGTNGVPPGAVWHFAATHLDNCTATGKHSSAGDFKNALIDLKRRAQNSERQSNAPPAKLSASLGRDILLAVPPVHSKVAATGLGYSHNPTAALSRLYARLIRHDEDLLKRMTKAQATADFRQRHPAKSKTDRIRDEHTLGHIFERMGKEMRKEISAAVDDGVDLDLPTRKSAAAQLVLWLMVRVRESSPKRAHFTLDLASRERWQAVASAALVRVWPEEKSS